MTTVVKTGIANYRLRSKVRILAELYNNTNIFFLLGQTDDEEVLAEAKKFGDIVFGAFNDTYANLPLKTFLGYEFFVNHCRGSPALIVQDDDVVVNYDAVLATYGTRARVKSRHQFFRRKLI